MYYEVKAIVKTDKKNIKRVFLAETSSIVLADALVQSPDLVKVTGIVEKDFVNVFVDKGDKFYECKVVYEDIEGKEISETYIQTADSTSEAETALLSNLTYKPEFKSVKETIIFDIYK